MHITPREADRRLAALARRQHGCVTTAQLLAAGLHRNAIATRMRRGLLKRLHYGVYLIGAPNTQTPYLAAVLACGPAALLSHRAAAVVWRIVNTRPGAIDVTVTQGHRRSRPGIKVHQSPAERTARHGIPITTPQRTLEDLKKILGADAY